MGKLRSIKHSPFGETLSNYSVSVRIVFGVMITGGLLSLVAGTVIDLYKSDWLQGLSYLPNVWAGFTGSFIGVPLALVILDTFTGQREETEALKRVNTLSSQAWKRFRESVAELCSDERINGLKNNAKFVLQLHNDILQEYAAYRERASQLEAYRMEGIVGIGSRGATEEETEAFQRYLKVNHEELQAQIYEVFNRVGNHHSFQVLWSGVRTNWTTLDQYVRLQRLERGLQWFSPVMDADLSNRLSNIANPLVEFFDVHHVKNKHSTDSMLSALATIDHHAKMDKEQLDEIVLAEKSPGNVFGHQPVNGYIHAAIIGRDFLESLRDLVRRIDETGWPESESKPIEGLES
ncbi:hypothetical protein [Mycobacterium paraense]|uniref:hypothetical protein n=1 Tax=Mycobacterium paraense TaxID=767916 RepID=UPI00114D7A77|nr:hypothetical protein [Mycobacterium paraense]